MLGVVFKGTIRAHTCKHTGIFLFSEKERIKRLIQKVVKMKLTPTNTIITSDNFSLNTILTLHGSLRNGMRFL